MIKRKPWPESGYVSTLFSRHISLQILNVKMSVEQFLKLSTIFFSSLKTFNYFLQKNVFLIKQSPGAFPKINQISEVAARRWLRSSYLTDNKEVFRTLPNIMRYLRKHDGSFKKQVLAVDHVSKKALEAVAQRCSVKKVFLEISQNSQENNCVIVCFLRKLQASG